jgi:hypothetical protein
MLSKIGNFALQLLCSTLLVFAGVVVLGTIFANVRRMNVVLTTSWELYLVLAAASLAVRWLLFRQTHGDDDDDDDDDGGLKLRA